MPDIQRVSLLDGGSRLREISVEFPMHRACYLSRPDVGAVIHTHAPALTASGLREVEFTEFLPEAADSLGTIATVPYAPSGSLELAAMVSDAVAEGATLLLLKRHGAVTVGRNLAEAYERMEFGELTAKTALLALGGKACALV